MRQQEAVRQASDRADHTSQIASPLRVVAVERNKALPDGEAVAVGLESARKVALRRLHVADLVVRHRQITPPAGVAGIGFRQPVSDGEAIVVSVERGRKIALR
jgi:hypothetical protein